MRLAAFLAGVACGIVVCLWWIARGIATPEKPKGGPVLPGARYVIGERGPEEILPVFDPHLWRERMK